MSTRAIYVFSNNFDDPTEPMYAVYKHHDGYPEGAREFIKNAFPLAWELPRFEADEFAAAFVAANKNSPGGVRLYANAERVRDIIVNQQDAYYVYWIDFPPTTSRSKRERKYLRVRYQHMSGDMINLSVSWSGKARAFPETV